MRSPFVPSEKIAQLEAQLGQQASEIPQCSYCGSYDRVMPVKYVGQVCIHDHCQKMARKGQEVLMAFTIKNGIPVPKVAKREIFESIKPVVRRRREV